eukprot:CAMPEP_0194758744 /NCGR_PEP_ID=MMETSP0323_2-20130528/11950_1 /TAXON_ID=2866 ORGANISM="Crypthecodinium cohnii, Strain Seligo" /NCGR_SAMPLE_ID=MMETSP0323_2 /ASSEMBLY_ACC=CAM_ASM_000346 /LENGTH=74 /DNA_ID=CAMNT_0039679185 /DNA_START=221 /DNA_END=442 /DNA_ORIENTATION=+
MALSLQSSESLCKTPPFADGCRPRRGASTDRKENAAGTGTDGRMCCSHREEAGRAVELARKLSRPVHLPSAATD